MNADVQLILSAVAATATSTMLGATSIAYAAALSSTAAAGIVSGRDALPWVNHFIGTNNGSKLFGIYV